VITIENKVGRLVELRQTGKITIADIHASFPRFKEIMTKVGGPAVFATDWRGMRLMDRDTSDFLLDIMKSDEGVEAQVIITDASALMALQVKRMIQAGGGKHRMVYDDVERAERYLKPYLTPAEFAAFRSFLASYDPNA